MSGRPFQLFTPANPAVGVIPTDFSAPSSNFIPRVIGFKLVTSATAGTRFPNITFVRGGVNLLQLQLPSQAVSLTIVNYVCPGYQGAQVTSGPNTFPCPEIVLAMGDLIHIGCAGLAVDDQFSNLVIVGEVQ